MFKFSKKKLKIFSSRTVSYIKAAFCMYVPNIGLYIISYFPVGYELWQVFHRHTEGKVKIGYFCSLIGDFRVLFLSKC